MSKKYCQYCGTELSSEAIFCSNCGAKVAENPSDVTAVTTIQDAIRKRSETNIRMSGAWIFIVIFSPLILFLSLVSIYSIYEYIFASTNNVCYRLAVNLFKYNFRNYSLL